MAPTLLTFGDSLSFHGPDGPYPADDERLWPNLAAAAIGGRTELFAGQGWTSRDAFWALAGDPRIWALLPTADVLVLGVGSMDTLPSPLPTYLREGLRYLRPDALRRFVRARYLAAQPWLARVTRGRPVALPPALTVHYLDRILGSIRALRPDLPAVGVLPPVHRAASYGLVHTGRLSAVPAIRAWGARAGVPLLDLADLTGEHVLSGRGNPDGMHWGWEGHARVGAALADLVAPLVARKTDEHHVG
ncbi:diglucosylglycerate octanoyltransferase [Actinophytocola gossypii]|uniref:SGNH/GDSL hydrolase family protein n=1 Tax=Actinophytocola gossypii TaxID=2812003 RepID=A0ABT2JH90_9PSEU|nr:diglucosylglycerate octanoyltransferase [Actinophytocola gossypii]MCT2586780.1 SGNH/GDSL hydrolase family protein [Actinophytocola gossypii]